MKKEYFSIFALLAFFAVMIYIIKPGTLVEIFESSNKLFLILALVSEIIALLIRTWRLKTLLGKVNLYDLFKVEMIGLATNGFSPFKSGDAFKAYLIKRKFGIPMSRGIARIMWEEMTNFIAYIIVSLWAVFFIPRKFKTFFFIASIVFAILIIYAVDLIYSKRGRIKIANFMSRFIKRKNVDAFFKSGQISRRKFLGIMSIAILMSFVDGTTFFLILKAFSINVSWIYAVSAFCASMIIGSAVLFLPAGIGSIDGVLFAMFSFANLKVVMTVILTYRIVTLWFVGLLGITFYFLSRM